MARKKKSKKKSKRREKGGRNAKKRGTEYEWKVCKLVEGISPFYMWHIGGSAPGWDNLLFADDRLGIWSFVIPIEVKSFKDKNTWIYMSKKDRRVYDQYQNYKKIYEEGGPPTTYFLRWKDPSHRPALDKWRAQPHTEIEEGMSKNGNPKIHWRYEKAMPLERFIKNLVRGKPYKKDLKKWKWLNNLQKFKIERR